MPDPKTGAQKTRTTSPDSLTRTAGDAAIELTESDLDAVTGGMTNNQQTTAQKAAEKVDQYIRS